jgi:hypothetical protein
MHILTDDDIVYQLSAQFPGPTSPREFITLLITSETCLTDASKVGDSIPRHFLVVSIPVSHPDAPPRQNMVRGYYESIEMIREIPLKDGDAETNPVEWIMVTRSDPGGGIPRFMVERNVPSSIVQDAVKFLDWACAKDDDVKDEVTADKDGAVHDQAMAPKAHDIRRSHSIAESNGITAGVGTSIADRPSHQRRVSHRPTESTESTGNQESLVNQAWNAVGAYLPASMTPVARTESSSSSSSSSSVESFASAEQYTGAREGAPYHSGLDNSIPPPSASQQSLPMSEHSKGLQKIEEKKEQLKTKLDQAREKHLLDMQNESQKTEKEIQKANEKHEKERKKQEEKYEKEIRKLEERREKETQKILARQQKEADKNQLGKATRERDEYKQRVDILEQENKLLKDQLGELQHENTALVARLGKTDEGVKILRQVKDEDMKGRSRASSASSGKTGKRSKGSSDTANTLGRPGTTVGTS